MKRELRSLLVVVISLLAVCGSAFAHHGSSASYDLSKVVTLHGTVTEFVWSNPHSQLYFDAKDENGQVVHWGGEMNSPGLLAGAGWTPHIVKPGDQITINLCPAKAGTPVGLVGKVILPDGKVLQGNGVLLHTKAAE
jgi:Family of unknown function (DUF6152)